MAPWPKVGANASTQSTHLHRPHREEDGNGIDRLTGPQAIVRRSGGPGGEGSGDVPWREVGGTVSLETWHGGRRLILSCRLSGPKAWHTQLIKANPRRAPCAGNESRGAPQGAIGRDGEPPGGSAVGRGKGEKKVRHPLSGQANGCA